MGKPFRGFGAATDRGVTILGLGRPQFAPCAAEKVLYR
jgi:hypothetical protein